MKKPGTAGIPGFFIFAVFISPAARAAKLFCRRSRRFKKILTVKINLC